MPERSTPESPAVPARGEADVTPACCEPAVDPRTARHFDGRAGQWTDGEAFPALAPVSERLLDGLLRDSALVRPWILDLGCGTGGLSVALLEAGAGRVTGVDISAKSIGVARARAAAAGYARRARFEVGDAASGLHPEHDWVVLDRVICCYRHVDRMVTSAIHSAGRRIALSVPESRGWRGLINRPRWAIEALWGGIRGGCPGYVHDVPRIERQLAAAGFRPTRTARTMLWHAGIYDRS